MMPGGGEGLGLRNSDIEHDLLHTYKYNLYSQKTETQNSTLAIVTGRVTPRQQVELVKLLPQGYRKGATLILVWFTSVMKH